MKTLKLRLLQISFISVSTFQVITGGRDLRMSWIKYSNLIHWSIRFNRLSGVKVHKFATLQQEWLIHVEILQLRARFPTWNELCSKCGKNLKLQWSQESLNDEPLAWNEFALKFVIHEKSWAQLRSSLKLSSELIYLKIDQLLLS